jgi:hypothetical protein
MLRLQRRRRSEKGRQPPFPALKTVCTCSVQILRCADLEISDVSYILGSPEVFRLPLWKKAHEMKSGDCNAVETEFCACTHCSHGFLECQGYGVHVRSVAQSLKIGIDEVISKMKREEGSRSTYSKIG